MSRHDGGTEIHYVFRAPHGMIMRLQADFSALLQCPKGHEVQVIAMLAEMLAPACIANGIHELNVDGIILSIVKPASELADTVPPIDDSENSKNG